MAGESGITVADLDAAEPDLFRSAALAWFTHVSAPLDQQQHLFDRCLNQPLVQGAWKGSAATAAKSKIDQIDMGLAATIEYMSAFGDLLLTAAEGISEAQAVLKSGRDLAARLGLHLADDGTIVDPSWTPLTDGNSVLIPDTAVLEVSNLISQALSHAQAVVDELVPRLRNPKQFSLSTDNSSHTDAQAASDAANTILLQAEQEILPPTGADQATVSAWWAGLPPWLQQQKIFDAPNVIGSLPGIPAPARDEANRLIIPQEEAQLTGQLNALKANEPTLQVTMPAGGGTPIFWNQDEVDQWKAEVSRLETNLQGIIDLQKAMDTYSVPGEPPKTNSIDGSSRPPLYVLGFDTDGLGHSVLSLGNPDTAKNVAISVMGTGTNQASIGGDIKPDGSVNGDIGRADAIMQTANRGGVYNPTASILWQGYDAPQSLLPDAAAQHYANDAAGKLASFESTIAQSNPAAHITVIGHSYGSLVVGEAASAHGMHPGDLVFIGSPGVGVDSVGALGEDPSHVWSGHISDDPITLSPPVNPLRWSGLDPHLRYGVDPTTQAFGDKVFATADLGGHSGYWDAGTDSLKNIGAIVAGQYSTVSPGAYSGPIPIPPVPGSLNIWDIPGHLTRLVGGL